MFTTIPLALSLSGFALLHANDFWDHLLSTQT